MRVMDLVFPPGADEARVHLRLGDPVPGHLALTYVGEAGAQSMLLPRDAVQELVWAMQGWLDRG